VIGRSCYLLLSNKLLKYRKSNFLYYLEALDDLECALEHATCSREGTLLTRLNYALSTKNGRHRVKWNLTGRMRWLLTPSLFFVESPS
jgi:hypothetical protein